MAWQNLPDGFEAKYKNDAAGLKAVMDERINYWVPYWGNRVVEWDVVNEPFSGSAGWDIVGWDRIGEYVTQVKEMQPGMKTYINDWGCVIGGQAKQDNVYNLMKGLIDKGVPIDGLGMQYYPDGSFNVGNAITNVQRFAALGLDLKLTEYAYGQGQKKVPEDSVKAKDTSGLLLGMFSIKECKGFIYWGNFGPNGILNPNAELSEMGCALAYFMYDKWWTNEAGTTGADGTFGTRGYFGEYNITVTADGKTKTVPVKHLMYGNGNFEINID